MLNLDACMIVANLFAMGQTSVRLDQFNLIRKEINSTLDMVMIDSVRSFDEWHMFRQIGAMIYRGCWFGPEDYLTDWVKYAFLPVKAKSKIQAAISKLLDEGLKDDFLEIFTPEHVNKTYNWRIPDDVREEFLAIIRKHYIDPNEDSSEVNPE